MAVLTSCDLGPYKVLFIEGRGGVVDFLSPSSNPDIQREHAQWFRKGVGNFCTKEYSRDQSDLG